MDDMWTRIAADLLDRVSGPMKFRLLLQPIMASIFAIKAGLHDARTGPAAVLLVPAVRSRHRGQHLIDGWKSVGKVFVLALGSRRGVSDHRDALRVSRGGLHHGGAPRHRAVPDAARPRHAIHSKS